MDSKGKAQLNIPEVDVLKTQWEEFRPNCFARYGTSTFWVWSAAEKCDLYIVVLSMMNTPGFGVELLEQAVCLTAFGDTHLIPLAQMTRQSMFDLQHLIVEGQRNSMELQRQVLHERFDIDEPTEGLHGVLH